MLHRSDGRGAEAATEGYMSRLPGKLKTPNAGGTQAGPYAQLLIQVSIANVIMGFLSSASLKSLMLISFEWTSC